MLLPVCRTKAGVKIATIAALRGGAVMKRTEGPLKLQERKSALKQNLEGRGDMGLNKR